MEATLNFKLKRGFKRAAYSAIAFIISAIAVIFFLNYADKNEILTPKGKIFYAVVRLIGIAFYIGLITLLIYSDLHSEHSMFREIFKAFNNGN